MDIILAGLLMAGQQCRTVELRNKEFQQCHYVKERPRMTCIPYVYLEPPRNKEHIEWICYPDEVMGTEIVIPLQENQA
jgi:hypothetical protein